MNFADEFRRAILWACLLASPFFLGLVAGWVFSIRLNPGWIRPAS